MKRLADDLYLLDGFPPFAINVYLMADVLVDAGSRHAAKRILRQLSGRTVSAHALTHAHPDHQGASHEVCETLNLQLWCGALDADAMQDGRIMARQPKHPINVLIGLTLGALYVPSVWPDLAFLLADLEQQVSSTALGQRVADLRVALGLAAAPQEEYPNFVEAGPGVGCSDSVNPRDFGAWQTAADKAEATYGRFGRIWNWALSPCRSWPTTAGQDRYMGPWTARTSSPVLIVGNYFDPATPYQGAETASKLLPNSRLLSYAGWGHTAYLQAGNFCVDSLVTTYLLTSRVPPEGTVCQPEGSPFGPESASARDQAVTGLTAAAVPEAVRRALHAD